MSASSACSHFTRRGGMPEPTSESDDPTFAIDDGKAVLQGNFMLPQNFVDRLTVQMRGRGCDGTNKIMC